MEALLQATYGSLDTLEAASENASSETFHTSLNSSESDINSNQVGSPINSATSGCAPGFTPSGDNILSTFEKSKGISNKENVAASLICLPVSGSVNDPFNEESINSCSTIYPRDWFGGETRTDQLQEVRKTNKAAANPIFSVLQPEYNALEKIAAAEEGTTGGEAEIVTQLNSPTAGAPAVFVDHMPDPTDVPLSACSSDTDVFANSPLLGPDDEDILPLPIDDRNSHLGERSVVPLVHNNDGTNANNTTLTSEKATVEKQPCLLTDGIEFLESCESSVCPPNSITTQPSASACSKQTQLTQYCTKAVRDHAQSAAVANSDKSGTALAADDWSLGHLTDNQVRYSVSF